MQLFISKYRVFFTALLPIALLVVLIFSFLKYGPLGVLKISFPPIEKVVIQRVEFTPDIISLEVINDGHEEVTIAQALVNNAYWQFSIQPSYTLKPLQKGYISISYPWNFGDAEFITLVSKNGVTFEKEVEVAVPTPQITSSFIKTFVILGLYVGVIPVLLGLIWFPLLKRLRGKGYQFLLSLTIGLLIFLGFDALAESLELLSEIPDSLNAVGILVIGFILAVLLLSAVSYKTEHYSIERGEDFKALVWAYLIALGIGLHNLGEGLAIGSAYAIGEIVLGSTLVIGFMIHNVTEGVAIIAPIAKTARHARSFLWHLIIMGLIAGVPTIFGTLIGGFSYSQALAVFFLSIGAGAIFDVAFDILHQMKKDKWLSIFTVTNVLGFLCGLLVMYGTGLLVIA